MWDQSPLVDRIRKREQTVTLYPRLVVRGRVTDAETGRPVLKFRVVHGMSAIVRAGGSGTGPRSRRWRSRTVDTRSRSDRTGEGVISGIDLAGLRPAISRAFQPTEGSQKFTSVLRTGQGAFRDRSFCPTENKNLRRASRSLPRPISSIVEPLPSAPRSISSVWRAPSPRRD